jgi:hypothetical protein
MSTSDNNNDNNNKEDNAVDLMAQAVDLIYSLEEE